MEIQVLFTVALALMIVIGIDLVIKARQRGKKMTTTEKVKKIYVDKVIKESCK